MRFLRSIVKILYSEFRNDHGRQPVLDEDESVADYGEAWLSSEIPEKQWAVAKPQIDRLQNGELTPEFAGFIRAIRVGLHGQLNMERRLLEIGCSSGYYGKVLSHAFPEIEYVGVDFSNDFIKFGQQKFSDLNLHIGDTTDLRFDDQEFEIVVSGSVLLHVYEWKLAVKETCRVTSNLLIVHRTPASTKETALFVKKAYGVKMIEWTFNEQELVKEVTQHNFHLIESFPVYPGDEISDNSSEPKQFTYVFRRNF
jgi:ubiquinone/menaquinone biosynthesis C-methylase UbiE